MAAETRKRTGQRELTEQFRLMEVTEGAYGRHVRISAELAMKMVRSGTLSTGEKQQRRGFKEQLLLLL